MKGKKPLNFNASEDEIRRFQKNIKAANQIQKRYTERQARLTGKPVEDIDPLFFKRSGKLSQFNTREEFLNALEDAENLGRKGYVKEIERIQKKNYIDAIGKVFGDRADEIVEKLNQTSARKLADAQAKGIVNHTGFVYYDPQELDAKWDELIEGLTDAGIL